MLARTLLPAWPPFPTARKLRREQCAPRTARRGGGYYSGDWRASRGVTGFVGGAGRCRWGVFARLDEAREEGQFVLNFTETLTWLWEGNFLPLPSLGGRRGVGEGGGEHVSFRFVRGIFRARIFPERVASVPSLSLQCMYLFNG